MPTILLKHGWRLFFYSNEGNEPVHIHCEKGEKEVKYWLHSKKFAIEESYSYNLNNKDKRQIRKIVYENFELIEEEWERFHGKR